MKRKRVSVRSGTCVVLALTRGPRNDFHGVPNISSAMRSHTPGLELESGETIGIRSEPPSPTRAVDGRVSAPAPEHKDSLLSDATDALRPGMVLSHLSAIPPAVLALERVLRATLRDIERLSRVAEAPLGATSLALAPLEAIEGRLLEIEQRAAHLCGISDVLQNAVGRGVGQLVASIGLERELETERPFSSWLAPPRSDDVDARLLLATSRLARVACADPAILALARARARETFVARLERLAARLLDARSFEAAAFVFERLFEVTRSQAHRASHERALVEHRIRTGDLRAAAHSNSLLGDLARCLERDAGGEAAGLRIETSSHGEGMLLFRRSPRELAHLGRAAVPASLLRELARLRLARAVASTTVEASEVARHENALRVLLGECTREMSAFRASLVARSRLDHEHATTLVRLLDFPLGLAPEIRVGIERELVTFARITSGRGVARLEPATLLARVGVRVAAPRRHVDSSGAPRTARRSSSRSRASSARAAVRFVKIWRDFGAGLARGSRELEEAALVFETTRGPQPVESAPDCVHEEIAPVLERGVERFASVDAMLDFFCQEPEPFFFTLGAMRA